MKFEFQNLGTIKKTTLDLRPLTVIVGPNNTSKTYLAYCVHGLARGLAWNFPALGGGDSEVGFDLRDMVVEAQKLTTAAARLFARRLPEYFKDTYGGLFANTRLGVRIDAEDVRLASQAIAATKESGFVIIGEKVFVKTSSTGEQARKQLLLEWSARATTHLLGFPTTLPAERNAFIITYRVLSARRYRVLRDSQSLLSFGRLASADNGQERQLTLFGEEGDIRYPAPIEDFLDFLTDVELEAPHPRNGARSPFGKLAKGIETHLQGGHRTAFEATKFGGSELAVTVSEHLRLDLYNASSSIKQVAPLLLYLRYRAAPNQTLIIDEPEMNLHPEGQAKLLEALGMLANLGVRILLTTHSPYFMAHLNNLIAGDRADAARRKRQAKHLYMGDPAAFLSPDDVSAYEMRADGLHSLADPEYGIRWDTLSDVSSELQRRYFAIAEEPKGRAKAK